MKTKNLMYALLISLLFSCNGQIKETKNNNILLSNKVQAQYIVDLKDTILSKEWVTNFDKEYLFKNTFNQVFTNKINVFNPTPTYYTDSSEIMNKEDILKYLNWDTISNNYNELTQLVFFEEWNVDTNLKSFSKIVLAWSPVRTYYRNGDKETLIRKKIFNVFPKENNKGNLIGKDVFYKCEIKDYCQYPFYTGLDINIFLETIIKKVENKDIKAYDPIYIVDRSKKALSFDEIKKIAESPLNSREFREGIYALIFEEDWYFDKETLNIQKEVKSIGFVKWNKIEGREKILFFIDFE